MTNTQLLYSQHVENVRHDRAMEEAKAADIANEQRRNELTSRQLDITEEYNRQNLEIQRRKLAQDYAISTIANQLREKELNQKQQQFVDSWEQNAKRQSAELARTEAEANRANAQAEATTAEAIEENPIGYLAIKGTDKLINSLPGAQEVMSAIWPSAGEKFNHDLEAGEAMIGGTNYTNQQKLDIAERVQNAIENAWTVESMFKSGNGLLGRKSPMSQKQLWEKCAPTDEVSAWNSLTAAQRAERFGSSKPWINSYWNEKYQWYTENFMTEHPTGRGLKFKLN